VARFFLDSAAPCAGLFVSCFFLFLLVSCPDGDPLHLSPAPRLTNAFPFFSFPLVAAWDFCRSIRACGALFKLGRHVVSFVGFFPRSRSGFLWVFFPLVRTFDALQKAAGLPPRRSGLISSIGEFYFRSCCVHRVLPPRGACAHRPRAGNERDRSQVFFDRTQSGPLPTVPSSSNILVTPDDVSPVDKTAFTLFRIACALGVGNRFSDLAQRL